MRDPYETQPKSDYPYPQRNLEWEYRIRVFGFTVIGIIVLWNLCGHLPEKKDFWTVFIGALVSYLVLMAMFIQIKIASKQAKISERQEAEMTKQREAAEKQNTLTEQSVELARLSAQVTEDQLQLAKLTQRPDINLILTFAPIGDDNIIQMLFNAPNVGQTTAYRFGIHISADWRPKDFDDVLHYGKPNLDEAEPIRVGIPHFIHPANVYRPLGTIISMKSGETWMIVFGIYWYYDGAGNRYEEIFCRRFNHLDPANAVQCEGSLRSKVVE